MEELCNEFEAWCGGEGLPGDLDAQEMLLVASVGGMELTGEQASWLKDFIDRWDTQQALEDA